MFEKENIWTFDSKGELLITIMSSLAQEESRSISENCTWGQRKRFADGKVTVPFKRFLGYDRGEDGNLVVNEEQSKIVRRIYGLFLQGKSPYVIARQLTEEGIPTPGGKRVWGRAVVQSILTNEKYKGDALLQKVYTTDFLTKKKKANEGEVPQYYVEGNHEAIIDPAVFDRVQLLMQSRCPGKNRSSSVSIFSSKIKCADCGSWYGSKVWHSNDKYRKVIWQCNRKFKEKCHTPHLDEETIKAMFIKAANILAGQKDSLIDSYTEIEQTAFDTTALAAEQKQLQEEMNVVAELIEQCIADNARVAQNQADYESRYNALAERYDKVKGRLETVGQSIIEMQAQREQMRHFIHSVKAMPETIDIFDEDSWCALVDYVTVGSETDVVFTMKNGLNIKI